MELSPPASAAVISRPNRKIIEAFGAIVNFVNDLWDVFGKNTTSGLSLYHRLIGRIGLSDAEGMHKAINGFEEFLKSYESYLVNNQLEKIPRNTVIKYGSSDKIYLDVQRFIYQSDQPTKETIRQHLLTISTILEPNKEKMAQLEKRINDLNIDTSTKEGRFITGIMEKAKTNMNNVSTEDPMQAMMHIFQSGIIQEMVVGLQQGVGSGDMNMHALLGTMQNALGSIIPPQAKVEELPENKDSPQ